VLQNATACGESRRTLGVALGLRAFFRMTLTVQGLLDRRRRGSGSSAPPPRSVGGRGIGARPWWRSARECGGPRPALRCRSPFVSHADEGRRGAFRFVDLRPTRPSPLILPFTFRDITDVFLLWEAINACAGEPSRDAAFIAPQRSSGDGPMEQKRTDLSCLMSAPNRPPRTRSSVDGGRFGASSSPTATHTYDAPGPGLYLAVHDPVRYTQPTLSASEGLP
jgi:hypothetical protein